jgi:hypothetical protein
MIEKKKKKATMKEALRIGSFMLLTLVGVLLYWVVSPVWGISLIALGFFTTILEILVTELNPKIAMAMNFFLPGLGFIHCQKRCLILGGLVLCLAFMTPQLSGFTVPSIIITAITKLSTLTLQQVFLGIFSSSLFAVLGYFSAKRAKNRTR